MNRADTIEMETVTVSQESVIHLPLGLLGLEHIKRYVLLSDPHDEPFQWLQVLEDPGLAFLVLSPFQVMPAYEMDLSQDDANFLGIDSSADALVLNIVTLHADGRATLNLKGPIVLNRQTLVGKQVVLANAADYSLQHPLPTAD